MKAISLFSGIEGLGLGLARAGIETVARVEIEPHAQAVLRYHYPGEPLFDDVRTFAVDTPVTFCPDCEDEAFCKMHGQHFADCPCTSIQQVINEVGQPDVLHGGFPCTQISAAADRWGGGGLDGEDSGLWFEYARIIRALQPTWLVIENTGRLRNGRQGADFRTIVGQLAGLGYMGLAGELDAGAYGLPGRRPRVFLLARNARSASGMDAWRRLVTTAASNDVGRFLFKGARQPCATNDGADRPTPGTYRLFTARECERQLGFPDDWTRYGTAPSGTVTEIATGWRRRVCGNAVAVPVAEWVGRCLVEADSA